MQLLRREPWTACPPGTRGCRYKFPFGTEKKTYQFFDTTAKKAYPMTYKGSEQIQGLTVYRFEQPVGPVQIGESEVPGEPGGRPTAPSVTVPAVLRQPADACGSSRSPA